MNGLFYLFYYFLEIMAQLYYDWLNCNILFQGRTRFLNVARITLKLPPCAKVKVVNMNTKARIDNVMTLTVDCFKRFTAA